MGSFCAKFARLSMQRSLLILLALTLSLPVSAATIEGVRLWSGPDQNRLVFDLNGPVSHKLFVLHSPERVVVDIKNARLLHDLGRLDLSKSFVHRVRSATHNGNLRVVLDMRGKVQPKSFLLKPTQKYGHR
ncbi:MAG TPA: AMIN domain-containing protein, partial [Chromatiales bacterium]|nr:AMIN domain-containing protein [Chromatiales bacterium]HEX23204.1 AMIN domain-containing protein [Chromatiales bacterium]